MAAWCVHAIYSLFDESLYNIMIGLQTEGPGRSANLYQSYWEIIITIEKEVPFGEAVYVCGSLPELGLWQPHHSLKLRWKQGHVWEGALMVPKGTTQSIEFKFVVSDWNIYARSNIYWEFGNFNRRIDLFYAQNRLLYTAQWNKERIVICLHTRQNEDSLPSYYITGNLGQLGLWKEKRPMRVIDKPLKEAFAAYFYNDHDFTSEANLSLGREVEWFNYFYVRVGDTTQSETYPGRILRLESKRFQNGRINEFDWMGSKVVVDETSFDQLVLEKMNNLIYFACHLKSTSHFNKMLQKNITAVLNLNSRDEDFTIPNYHIKNLCRDHKVLIQNWTIQDLAGPKFIKEAEEIVSIVENFLVIGHRVCIHCSRKVMRSIPINLLYLTLLVGYSYGEALEIMSRDNPLSEMNCYVALEVYNLISTKILRGRTTIQMK